MSLALFVLYTALLGVMITFFLFFSSRLLGFIVSKLLSTFWVGADGFIRIGIFPPYIKKKKKEKENDTN